MVGKNLVFSASFRYKRMCLKDYPHNLTKHEINGKSIYPVYQPFIIDIVNYSLLLLLFIVKWEKFESVAQAYTQKNHFFIFFMNLKKLRSPRATFKNPKISSLIGKNLEAQPNTNTQKISILTLWMSKKNLCPNLNFTVKNKVGHLHKARLFTFQTQRFQTQRIMNEVFHYL